MSKTRHDSEAYHREKAAGRCGVCSNPRGEGGTRSLCYRCAVRQRVHNRERYRKRHPDHGDNRGKRVTDDQRWEEVGLLDHVDCLPSRL